MYVWRSIVSGAPRLLALLALAHSSPVSATTIYVTYTGIVSGSFDTIGVFGPAGSSLSDAQFTAVFTIDTDNGVYATNGFGGYTFTEGVIGGSAYSATTPATANLSINGHTIHFGGNFRSYDYVYIPTNSSPPLRQTFQDSVDYFPSDDALTVHALFFEVFTYLPLIPDSIFTPFSVPLSQSQDYSAGAYSGGSFSLWNSKSGDLAFGNFSPRQLTVSFDVPEPPTLPLLLGGLVGMLWFSRRWWKPPAGKT